MLKYFIFLNLCCCLFQDSNNYILKGLSFFIRTLAFKEWRGLHFYSSVHRMPEWVQSIFTLILMESRAKIKESKEKQGNGSICWRRSLQVTVFQASANLFVSFEKNILIAVPSHMEWSISYWWSLQSMIEKHMKTHRKKFQTC